MADTQTSKTEFGTTGKTGNRHERTVRATPQEVWDLWATKQGLESWWGPEGFTTTVSKLELRPGGSYEYTMKATGQEQIELMKKSGLPVTSTVRGKIVEANAPRRLVFTSTVDFIPNTKPYDVQTTVEITPQGDNTKIVVTEGAMHNDEWTKNSREGMESSLEKFERVVTSHRKTTM